MSLFHPSSRKLERWLEHGGPDDVDAHVSECSRCANRLEELAAPTPELATALSESLRAPDDLVHRLDVRMLESMRSREEFAILLELLGLSLGTVRSLMSEDEQ